MIDELEKSKHLGTFTVGPDRQAPGELTLDGLTTCLHLWDKDFLGGRKTGPLSMQGVLQDLTKVSLSDCITVGAGSHHRHGEVIHSFKLFPHYAVFGNDHISFDEKTITEVSFVIDDATILFHDLDAFGHVADARPLIEQVVQSEGLGREIKTGEFPIISYFTGKKEIFAVDTALGRVSASHNPSYGMGGPHGVEIENTICVSLQFPAGVTFKAAMDGFYRILVFLELIVGRPQNLLQFMVFKEADQERTVPLEVYPSGFPKHKRSGNKGKPHPSDVLLDAAQKPEEFSHILADWLKRDETWHNARERFFSNFSRQATYGKDRLIGAANMFDILPEEAVAAKVELSEELESATERCCKIFKDLPSSPERDSVLSSLGRVGKNSLKRKIRHRGQFVIDRIGNNLPELFTVTDEAVNCRNHYVHGTQSRIDYSKETLIQIFLTKTLEFVFAASDLIEAGVDVNGLCDSGRGLRHPLGLYLETYELELSKLKSLLHNGVANQIDTST